MKEADRGMLWLCIENIVPSMTCGISLTCAMNYLTLGHFLKEKTYCIQIYAANTTLKNLKKKKKEEDWHELLVSLGQMIYFDV